MRQITTQNVQNASALGYTLYKNGVAAGGRTTAGIYPVGPSGMTFGADIDETTCDYVEWDQVGAFFSGEDILPAASGAGSLTFEAGPSAPPLTFQTGTDAATEPDGDEAGALTFVVGGE